jgi:hypothetical protein
MVSATVRRHAPYSFEEGQASICHVQQTAEIYGVYTTHVTIGEGLLDQKPMHCYHEINLSAYKYQLSGAA